VRKRPALNLSRKFCRCPFTPRNPPTPPYLFLFFSPSFCSLVGDVRPHPVPRTRGRRFFSSQSRKHRFVLSAREFSTSPLEIPNLHHCLTSAPVALEIVSRRLHNRCDLYRLHGLDPSSSLTCFPRDYPSRRQPRPESSLNKRFHFLHNPIPFRSFSPFFKHFALIIALPRNFSPQNPFLVPRLLPRLRSLTNTRYNSLFSDFSSPLSEAPPTFTFVCSSFRFFPFRSSPRFCLYVIGTHLP